MSIIFEGALRKWLLPSVFHAPAYLAKDFLAAAFVLTHPLNARSSRLKAMRNFLLSASILLLPSFLVGWQSSPADTFLTLKNAVLWPVFAFHLAAYLRPPVIGSLTTTLALISVPMSVLAICQFSLPPSHFLNLYAWNASGVEYERALVTADRGVRASGTFSYLVGLAHFSAFCWCWFVWRGTTSDGGKRLWCIVGSFASVATIFATGSRTPLACSALSIIAVLILTRRFTTFLKVGATVLVCMGIGAQLTDKNLFGAYFERATTSGDTFKERAIDPLTWFIGQLGWSLMGDGLGRHSQLQTFLYSREFGTASVISHEDPRARAASEAGIFGICFLFATALLFSDHFLRCIKTRNPEARLVTGALGAVAMYHIWNCTWYDHVSTALWWFAVGAWLNGTVKIAIPTQTRRLRRQLSSADAANEGLLLPTS